MPKGVTRAVRPDRRPIPPIERLCWQKAEGRAIPTADAADRVAIRLLRTGRVDLSMDVTNWRMLSVVRGRMGRAGWHVHVRTYPSTNQMVWWINLGSRNGR